VLYAIIERVTDTATKVKRISGPHRNTQLHQATDHT
jgi:hypothetical protein